jgi:hypothetical protein
MKDQHDDPGASRAVREWLSHLKMELVDPTPEDLRDLDRVMDHDEFWEWSSGKVDLNHWVKSQSKLSWKGTLLTWAIACIIVGSVVLLGYALR